MAIPVRRIQHFWVGLLLILVCWPLNRSPRIDPSRTACLFFPLWLGYILRVDGQLFALRSFLWPVPPKLHI